MKQNGKSKKGFTLAELLIVIAIIAILVAIMFPVFGAQLDKARAAAELSNVRAAYSEAVAEKMLGADNNLTEAVADVSISLEDDLGPALVYEGSKITVIESSTDGVLTKIEVEYEGYKGSFSIDEDVKVTSTTADNTYTKSAPSTP